MDFLLSREAAKNNFVFSATFFTNWSPEMPIVVLFLGVQIIAVTVAAALLSM
ncbi:hypothetical protein [Acidovorax sp.]|uniref:hypothetical protein n=1 Tax=Acidovorax sp. TaxID=1872122 RepID=UPI00391981C1